MAVAYMWANDDDHYKLELIDNLQGHCSEQKTIIVILCLIQMCLTHFYLCLL